MKKQLLICILSLGVGTTKSTATFGAGFKRTKNTYSQTDGSRLVVKKPPPFCENNSTSCAAVHKESYQEVTAEIIHALLDEIIAAVRLDNRTALDHHSTLLCAKVNDIKNYRVSDENLKEIFDLIINWKSKLELSPASRINMWFHNICNWLIDRFYSNYCEHSKNPLDLKSLEEQVRSQKDTVAIFGQQECYSRQDPIDIIAIEMDALHQGLMPEVRSAWLAHCKKLYSRE